MQVGPGGCFGRRAPLPTATPPRTTLTTHAPKTPKPRARAAVHFEMGDFEACAADCDAAVSRGRELRSDYALIGRALSRKGNALVKLGRLQEVRGCFGWGCCCAECVRVRLVKLGRLQGMRGGGGVDSTVGVVVWVKVFGARALRVAWVSRSRSCIHAPIPTPAATAKHRKNYIIHPPPLYNPSIHPSTQAIDAYNKSLMEHRSADTLKRLQDTERALKVGAWRAHIPPLLAPSLRVLVFHWPKPQGDLNPNPNPNPSTSTNT
jgi:hypothetical protein